MTILKRNDKVMYTCLICGHAQEEPFSESSELVTVYEPIVENTPAGKRTVAKAVHHKRYVCPNCNTAQIEV